MQASCKPSFFTYVLRLAVSWFGTLKFTAATETPMSEKDINRWNATVQPESRRPYPWTLHNGGSWDMFDVAPIPDPMLSELAQRYRTGGTPWNCRSFPVTPGDREWMYLLYSSMEGLVSRMRYGERMVGDLLELLRRCGSDITEADRATDGEWDAVVKRARALLAGKFEEARGE